MNREFSAGILSRLPGFKVAVVGDFCLDKYVHVDLSIDESSRESGKRAYQVTHVRTFPGGAGTVCANLAALGFGEVLCFGVTGGDGEGYELRRGLSAIGCNLGNLLVTDRLTNTFLKPVDNEMREMERLDYRTRTPLPRLIAEDLADRLEAALPELSAIIVLDQFDIPAEGLITGDLLDRLLIMAKSHPHIVFYADSRVRPGDFTGMTVKCNHLEAGLSIGLEPDESNMPVIARRLLQMTGKPAFITCGERGIISVSAGKTVLSPTFPIEGPIDIVGAGDAASSGLVAALCCGAAQEEAAFFANLVSSVTIKKLGVTGTASPDEILRNAVLLEGAAASSV